MSDDFVDSQVNRLLAEVRDILVKSAPDLLGIFEAYKGEVKFGRQRIDSDLQRLKRHSSILEVGAGSLLLSCALQREGFDVTALEPASSGFSHFVQLQKIVLRHAQENGFAPTLLTCAGEELTLLDRFDYAFSINVMEHVRDVSSVLNRVYRSLRPGGTYRFICPNYAFPYEPHFNMPTLFSQSLTEKFLWHKIVDSKCVLDPLGTWASLNWINVPQVRCLCRRELSVEPSFSRDIFKVFLDRALSDSDFQSRRGPFMVRLIDLVNQMQLLRVASLVPVILQPMMDCTIARY